MATQAICELKYIFFPLPVRHDIVSPFWRSLLPCGSTQCVRKYFMLSEYFSSSSIKSWHRALLSLLAF